MVLNVGRVSAPLSKRDTTLFLVHIRAATSPVLPNILRAATVGHGDISRWRPIFTLFQTSVPTSQLCERPRRGLPGRAPLGDPETVLDLADSVGLVRPDRMPGSRDQRPANAACKVAMSSFTIFSIASDARFEAARSGDAIMSNITFGTICHDTP